MHKRSLLALVVVALGLFLAACGGDDEKTVTESSTEADAAAVVLPASEVSSKDGAQAHSEAAIRECSSIDLEGDVGSAAFGGYQDISVAGISCEDARPKIPAVYDTYADGKVDSEIDGYDCSVIEHYSDDLNTVRCFTSNDKDAFRFTAVPKGKRHVELVAECGTFGRFYDVSVRGQGCQAGATFLDNTPTSELTAIPAGDKAKVGNQTCTTLYVEGNTRTVRCTEGKASLRASIAVKASAAHHKHYVEKPQEAAVVVKTKTKEPKPATKHGLSPNVTISCTASGSFDAITAKGINCAAVTVLLTQNETKLEALKSGQSIQIGTPPSYECELISSGSQTDTVQCSAQSGATFRASFIPPSSSPPAQGNPPATTTPAAAGGGADADGPAMTTTDAQTGGSADDEGDTPDDAASTP